jgi:tRNA threonylcarbamoyladenosine biosynthesis protein TsaB
VKILALDTATEALSVALLVDDRLTVHREVIGRGHAERLLPVADDLLARAGVAIAALDAIAFGRGPGAFTGVRIAISVAQGLGLGSGVGLVAVSDLLALAFDALAREPGARLALACLDARMGEVYWGRARRDADGLAVLEAEGLAAPPHVPAPDPGIPTVGAGHGFRAYPALGGGLAAVHQDLLPDAAAIARLAVGEVTAGRLQTPATVEPVYLRNDVATRSHRPTGP